MAAAVDGRRPFAPPPNSLSSGRLTSEAARYDRIDSSWRSELSEKIEAPDSWLNGAGGGAGGAADIGPPMLIGMPIFIFPEPRLESDDESARCCASTSSSAARSASASARAAAASDTLLAMFAATRRMPVRTPPPPPPPLLPLPRSPLNRIAPSGAGAEPRVGTSASSALWLLACIRAPMGARTSD